MEVLLSLVFETIATEGIAVLSYLIGDDSVGVAALIDPCADVDRYVDLARKKKVAITHIFETHIHADLVSGSRELQARVGEHCRIYLSTEGGATYGFPHERLRDRDQFEFGSVLLVARHTPGHTPEHMAYLLYEKKHPDTPWGVLSGDSLFVNSAGRPDLLGDDQAKDLARKQFHTLRDFFLSLPESVMVYPAHGHGSPCGAEIGDRLSSAIGYERRFNSYLQIDNQEQFVKHALDSAPPEPTYYPRMKQINAKGPQVLGAIPPLPALAAPKFREIVQEKSSVLIDTRDMLAFGAGHVRGALNLGAAPMLSLWAGWLLKPEQPILLVAEESRLEEIQRLFLRTGYSNFAGYLVGGMTAWDNAGFPLEHVQEMTVHELKSQSGKVQIVDVRSPAEWEKGHIPGAMHIFLPELRDKVGQIDRGRPVAVYCDSGYRASIGASILKQEGLTGVSNVPGSWQAWKKMEYPIEKPETAGART